MPHNQLTKILAGILIGATLLLSLPTAVLAVPTVPDPAGTELEDATLPGPADTPKDTPSSPPATAAPGGANPITPPTAINPAAGGGGGGGNSSGGDSYACGVRTFAHFLQSLSTPIATFFGESVCLAIVLASLTAGQFACWIISTFIQPIFYSPTSTCSTAGATNLIQSTDSPTNTGGTPGGSGGTTPGGGGNSPGPSGSTSPTATTIPGPDSTYLPPAVTTSQNPDLTNTTDPFGNDTQGGTNVGP